MVEYLTSRRVSQPYHGAQNGQYHAHLHDDHDVRFLDVCHCHRTHSGAKYYFRTGKTNRLGSRTGNKENMSSVSEFFAMGGYAFYVWGSYGVTAVFMIAEVILVIRNKRTITQRIARLVRMNDMNEQVDK